MIFFFFVNLVYCAKTEVHVTHTNRCIVLKRNGKPSVTVLNLAGTLAFGLHRQGLLMSRGGFGHLHKAGRIALNSLTIREFVTHDFERQNPLALYMYQKLRTHRVTGIGVLLFQLKISGFV